jgi:PLP dependent protein
MMSPEARLKDWQAKLAVATDTAGRETLSVRLIPASKTVDASSLREYYDAGQHVFGENRIQEAKAKIPLLPSACAWHFIGGLQRNKVRDAVTYFELIHSVDSIPLLEEIDKRAKGLGKVQRVLIEVNVAGESQKHGCSEADAPLLVEAANQMRSVSVEGFMTVAPFCEQSEETRPFFRRLKTLRDRLEQERGWRLPELSMGMTHDYIEAIAEGATMVRIGSGLFGKRE